MDCTSQGDNLENADHESLWEEQLDSGILCRESKEKRNTWACSKSI